MAVSSPPVSLAHGSDLAPAGATRNVNLGSITFTAGRLYHFAYLLDNTSTVTTVQGGGLAFLHGATDRVAAWTAITPTEAILGANSRVLAVWTYLATVTETVTFQATWTTADAASKFWSLTEVASGFDATTPNRQAKTGTGTSISQLQITFDSTPLAGSLQLVWYGSRAASSATSANAWTELTEDLGSGTTETSGGLEVQYDNTGAQPASVNFPGGRSIVGIAIEVQPSTGGGGGAQTLVPNGTPADGGWVDQAGAAVDLHSPLADESTTTYIQSPGNPSPTQIAKLALTNPSAPPGAGDITIEIDAEQI